MKETVANIPGKLYGQKSYGEREAFYHVVVLTLLWACDLHIHAEEWTSDGISDLVLIFERDVYVIEFKKKRPAAGIRQIEDKGYATKYAAAPYLALVGIEIDAKKRQLKGYKVKVVSAPRVTDGQPN
jgi:hypothetical protein